MNNPAFALRWNAVNQQIRLQLRYIELDLGIANLVAWWDLWSADYFNLVGTNAQTWARAAIQAAAAPYVQAHNNGVNLETYAQVIGALEEMLAEIENLNTPPITQMPTPQPP
jgi:chitinase